MMRKSYLKLVACYAYDRKKFLDKKIEIGEGLVGQCFLEKEATYMTVIPSDYVRITSGLGEATPKCIYLQPVQTKDEIVGVLELASFHELKDFEKKFIQRATENIAAAIISSRTTHRIKLLLADSQQRAEEMKAQEEEMRQNMEELQATQEEISRKQAETENRIRAVNESGVASIEFSLDGIIQDANDSFLNLMGYSLSEVKDKHHRIFVDKEYASSADYKKFWDDLKNGIPRPGEYQRVNKSGQKVFIKGSYSIITDKNGRPTRVLKLASDITQMRRNMEELQAAQEEMKRRQVDSENRIKAVNESGIASIEFSMDGTILNANESFLNLMGYTLDEVKGKHHRIFVDQEYSQSEEYRNFWKDLSDGIPRPGEYKRVKKDGKRVFIKGSYSIIRNESGKPVRVLKMAIDIMGVINQLQVLEENQNFAIKGVLKEKLGQWLRSN
ncbi:MAG: PAS domain S-box protein [Cyclobacteriaceae bacterium]